MDRAAVLAALAALAPPIAADAQGRGGGRGGGGTGGGAQRDAEPAPAGPANAGGDNGLHRSAAGGFVVWLPPAWIARDVTKRIAAQNRADSVDALIGPLDPDAELTDEDVVDFVDDEVDDLKVTSDAPATMGGLKARLLAGTGTDEGDAVVFRALAIDPGGDAPILMALVYGDDDIMAQDQLKAAVEHIFRSLKAA